MRYYRDPLRHPTRKYIGVVLQESHSLPLVPGVARKRRLGMYAQAMNNTEEEGDALSAGDAEVETRVTRAVDVPNPGVVVRRPNWQIGKIAERPENKVEPFQPGDRFLAWRKRLIKAKKATERMGFKKRKPRK